MFYIGSILLIEFGAGKIKIRGEVLMRQTGKYVGLNLLGLLAGGITYYISSFVLSFLLGLLLKVPLLVTLLSWPSTPELYLSVGINIGSVAIAFVVCSAICCPKERKKFGYLILCVALFLLYGYETIMRFFVMGYSDTVWGFLLSAIGCAAMFIEELKTVPEGSPGSSPAKSPELLEKEEQLAQVEKSLTILRQRHTQIAKDLEGVSEADILEMKRTGVISPDQAEDALDQLQGLQFLKESTPNSIRITEEIRDRLIDEINVLKGVK